MFLYFEKKEIHLNKWDGWICFDFECPLKVNFKKFLLFQGFDENVWIVFKPLFSNQIL